MSNTTYLFSVIIPTYNRANDLERCLTSLVNQIYKNFEVWVCDNGSTDNTKEVVEKYKKELNLNYLHNENSGGPAKPRNRGIRHANADWVCFLDSDDWYLENKLEVISKLNLDDIDFIYHDLNIASKNGITGVLTYRALDKQHAYYDLLCNSNAIGTSSTCIRKSFLLDIGGFSEADDIVSLEDFHLWIRLAKKGIRFYYLPMALGCNYFGMENLTQYNDRQIARFKALYSEFINIETDKRIKRKIKAVLNYCIAVANIKNKKFLKGFLLFPYAFLMSSPKLKKIILKKIGIIGG